MRNFVKCFLEIEKDGVCLYSIIDIVCKIVYELDKFSQRTYQTSVFSHHSIQY